jgi:hypothetical protein
MVDCGVLVDTTKQLRTLTIVIVSSAESVKSCTTAVPFHFTKPRVRYAMDASLCDHRVRGRFVLVATQ